jgi:uncharacterized membrane protein YkvA (DUF1232 family)
VPRDGYDRFRQTVARSCERLVGAWGREAAELILLIPDLLLLFVDLARDPRVSIRHKAAAAAVATYLISPIDFLPEVLLGPLGLADDVVLAFLALDLMLNHVDQEVVREHWRGEADLLRVAQAGLKLARRVVPAPLYDRLLRWLQIRF